MNVRQNVVRKFRKELLKRARAGQNRVRIVGQRGSYAVAVERGKTLHVVSEVFSLKKQAENWNMLKTGIVPVSRTTACELRAAA